MAFGDEYRAHLNAASQKTSAIVKRPPRSKVCVYSRVPHLFAKRSKTVAAFGTWCVHPSFGLEILAFLKNKKSITAGLWVRKLECSFGFSFGLKAWINILAWCADIHRGIIDWHLSVWKGFSLFWINLNRAAAWNRLIYRPSLVGLEGWGGLFLQSENQI